MMDKGWLKKAGSLFVKFKYAALVAALGLLLLLLPPFTAGGGAADAEKTASAPETFELKEFERKLSQILSKCEGVGNTEVLLTVKAGMESVYERDSTRSLREQADGGKQQHETDEESTLSILRSGSYGEEAVLIRQEYPKLMGALVICEGADSVSVRLKVTDAVKALTGISSENISVLKMK